MLPTARRAAWPGAWPMSRAGVRARSRGRAGSPWSLPPLRAGSLWLLQPHVLPGRGEIELRAQADAGLLDARADAVQGGRLEDPGEHHPVVHHPLDLVQERLSFFTIAL